MNKKIMSLCRFFIIFGLSFIILYPVIYMFSCSFRDSIDMNDPSVMWIPKHFTLDVIAETAEVMELPETLLNTFLLNLGCSVVQVMACAITGYGFARFDFFGKKFLFGIVIMMIIVPPQIISLPLYSNFVHLGLINSKLSMYLPALMGNGIRSGLMIFIFSQFFKGLPKEIEDSAYIDGCSRFRAFFSIMLPNAKSALLTVFLFSVVFYWNDYYISSLFFTDNQTVALMIKNLDSRLSIKLFNSSAVKASPREQIVWLEAGCLISVSPMLIMYTFLQRYFIEGIERSGIVG